MASTELPAGFIELECVGSGSPWHVRVDSIAGYGPEFYDHGQFVGCPVNLRGQPRSEERLVAQRIRTIAKMCIEAGAKD